ncbi:subtilisin-like protein [Lactarius hengduanensis]|nr:subtilisin-like protein [Lactarius hengduanensis]
MAIVVGRVCLGTEQVRGGGTFARRIGSLRDDLRAKHTWNSVPENWNNLGHPPADTTIDLHIALKAKNENVLIDTLIEVSSPGHPKHGKHLSREEVAELVVPPSDVLELTNAWLDHHGVHPSTVSKKHGGSWLTLTGIPVARANKLLSASYQLSPHAQLRGRPQGGDPGTVLSSRDQYSTPSFLRTFYKTSTYVPLAADWNMLGVAGYHSDWPSLDDLRQFMNRYRFDATDATYRVVQIKGGGYNSTNPTDEGNLNMQYTSAIAYPTTHIFYSTGSSDTLGDPFINWLDYVLGQLSVPQTVSTPYSTPEYKVPPEYAIHVCTLFARLGARGASVLFSSGNDGVGRGNCLVQDSSGNSRFQFLPTFPSTCPWVTSVGGTTGYNPEVAASLSGGGFSAYFPRPQYQSNFVPSFLRNLGNQYHGFYNPGGRGVPDIALQAMRFPIVVKGELRRSRGTSCSTPTAAGIISLLNDYRISNGRSPLGFLNIWLYSVLLPGLNDITSGSNPGCNTDGFSAVPGWDPVTGLGSLDFERLVAILSRW